MPEESGQEKTEEATPKKREEARKKGQVAKSVELNSAVILLTCFLMLYMSRTYLMNGIEEFFNLCFTELINYDMNQGNAYQLIVMIALKFFVLMLPIFASIMVVGVLINVVQVGFKFTPESISPKFSKLNPIEGLKQRFSVRSLVELLKSLLKLAIIVGIVYSIIAPNMQIIYSLIFDTTGGMFAYAMEQIFQIGTRTALAILILAVLDFGFQKWKFEQDLKMTREEVKEERKQTEGDPMVRSRIRTLQREIARKRMIDEVPKADVVITNPTALAIALKYDETSMRAPMVLAKGKGFIAQKIRNIAIDNDIPIVENKELTRAMFPLVQVGYEIPEEFFTAVAEILAYVFRLKNRRV